MNRRHEAATKLRRGEAAEYRLIFLVSFAIFLFAALVARLLPSRWRRRQWAARAYASPFAEARASVNTFVPFAFMG